MAISFSSVKPTLGYDQPLTLPPMVPVRQRFPTNTVNDVEVAVCQGLTGLDKATLRGKKIALTAGSRGIKGIVDVLRASVNFLKLQGAEPFIVPAMGSHGGATAKGQIRVLESLGITEASLAAPILSSMDVVPIGTSEHGVDVFCDKLAFEADGIVVCNRIKVHPVFKADYESGIAKMLVIGLGKHKGALAAHHHGFDRFAEIIPKAAELVLDRAPILCGIGVIENAYGGLAAIEVLAPDAILEREPELLSQAKRIMGRLLMDDIDILIVDEIGKDISGGGLDANVTGRSAWGLPGFVAPPIQRIIVRGLSKATHGNAIGIGLADLTTRACVEKIDLALTYTNALTAHSLLSPKIPVITENDRDALDAALHILRGGVPEAPRIVRIVNTKDLENIWMSETYQETFEQNPDLEVMGSPQAIRFNHDGSLIT